ncbi:MAG: hypothetical protein LW630_04915 [Saprospiraceae bacterium]|nr:hypothetical protein [Saprospiraceae bacterium]
MRKPATPFILFQALATSLLWMFRCSCFLASMDTVGQTVFIDSPPYLTQNVTEHLADQTDSIREILQNQGFDPLRFDILKVDNQLYLCPDGHFNLYQWKEGHWLNISRQQGMGYNFGGKKFVFNRQIHSYGGYGYWRNHGDVLRFDKKDSSWHLLQFTAGLKGGIARFTGKGLYVYGPLAYYIDLEKEKIYTIKNIMVPATQSDQPDKNTLDLGDYTFQKDKAVFIDPQAQTVYTSEVALSLLDGGNLMHKKYFLHLRGDSLTSMNCENKTVRRYSFPSITGPLVEAELRDHSVNTMYFLTAGAVLIILGFSFRVLRQKKPILNTANREEKFFREETTRIMINGLITRKQQQYSSQELDEVFQIYYPTQPVASRARRIQYIQEVNKMYMNLYGKELIIRSSDPNDGRKNIYEINP